eukprot:CAMPEP_0114566136 /NCGR_PEP_ID=MMETSP0114-20121206/14719_1 /TAXON_ID=31324 /ORGANISM="Goniomonas sp, Strain m" /LENGTH=283 /DNA_ID=CAMNT_0001752503 /DNA_START=101 /DNA_END=949 /DNA_ORIENTATION=+
MKRSTPEIVVPVAQHIWDSQVCCDMEVETDCGERIPCHSSFLVARSEFFSAKNRFVENAHSSQSAQCSGRGRTVTKVSGIQSSALRICIMSCYDLPPSLTSDNVVEVLMAADQLQMTLLGAECEKFCHGARLRHQASILTQVHGCPKTPAQKRLVEYLVTQLSQNLHSWLCDFPVAAKLDVCVVFLAKKKAKEIACLDTKFLQALGRLPDCSDVVIEALRWAYRAAPGRRGKTIETALCTELLGAAKKDVSGLEAAIHCVRRQSRSLAFALDSDLDSDSDSDS